MKTNTYLPIKAKVAELDDVAQQIGKTPLYAIQKAWSNPNVQIYAKLEWQQLGQSVKARAAYSIIRDAVLSGKLSPGKTLLDASSGNTGIAYAAISARLGIPLSICLPENASPARKAILKAYGAELIFTSPLEGTDGSQLKAREMYQADPNRFFYADQYNNPNNWKAHYHGTAQEIYYETQGTISHFVSALGTSGTFMGTGKRLKELHSNIELTALQPEGPMHGLEGWKDMDSAKVPGIFDPGLADQQLQIETEEAYEWVRRFAQTEGMLISPSAAANFVGAMKVARSLDSGKVVTIFPDDFSKYQDLYGEIF